MKLPEIQEIAHVWIVCPECNLVQEAETVLYEDAPSFAYVHECVNCSYVIMESEWQSASGDEIAEAQKELHLKLLTAVAQEAFSLPIVITDHPEFARALAEAANAGAFRPKGNQ